MSATDTLRLLHNTPVSRSSLQYLVGEAYFQKLRALRPFASAVHIKSLPVEVLTVILLLAPDRFDECPEAWWKSVLLLGCTILLPTVGDLFSLFSAACSVEQLVIKDVPCMDYDLAVDPFPVTDTVLPRLTHLSLEVKDYVDSCVFDTLVLPSLQRLHVRTDFEEGTKGVAGHLARAGTAPSLPYLRDCCCVRRRR
ncbi:hypothetical protein R3P38DRAFT_3221625 [Favolaschia claudopus]|uniref:Uncharacterized protein n=1 Tax=Favolaschia claudopus TaxID=2862362 RepID=A0AAV9ZZA1_9AGAR